LYIVLYDLTGKGHNIMARPGYTGTGFGNASDPAGTPHRFVDPTTPGAPSVPLRRPCRRTYAQHGGSVSYPNAQQCLSTPMKRSGPAASGRS
jgi:hypothetical protein